MSVVKRVNRFKQKQTACYVCDSLVTTHRDLVINQWDFAKNRISPFEISYSNTTENIHWKCPESEGHIWETSLGNRKQKNGKLSGCPYCSGNRISRKESINSEDESYRDKLLIKEWDSIKNEAININTISKFSSKKCWWLCSNCGCSFESTPANRNGINKTGCPECAIKLNKSGKSQLEKRLAEELEKYELFKGKIELNYLTSHKFKSNQRITVDFYIRDLICFDLDPFHSHQNNNGTDEEKVKVLNNFLHFFKLREHPLKLITKERDIEYFKFNPEELAEKIIKKFKEIYSYI